MRGWWLGEERVGGGDGGCGWVRRKMKGNGGGGVENGGYGWGRRGIMV
jgi:hypothetical protein